MATTDADREAWIARAKQKRIEDQCARWGIKLRKQGREFVGPCPHKSCSCDDDGFSVSPNKKLWSCRGCNKGGDVIELIMHVEGHKFEDAVEKLTSEPPPKKDRPNGKANGHDKAKPGGTKTPDETYAYTDENGTTVLEVVRFVFTMPDGSLELTDRGKPRKTFSQRRPDGQGAWIWGLDAGDYMRRAPRGDWIRFDEERFPKYPTTRQRKTFGALDRQVPYRLAQLTEAISVGHRVFIVEGERCA